MDVGKQSRELLPRWHFGETRQKQTVSKEDFYSDNMRFNKFSKNICKYIQIYVKSTLELDSGLDNFKFC